MIWLYLGLLAVVWIMVPLTAMWAVNSRDPRREDKPMPRTDLSQFVKKPLHWWQHYDLLVCVGRHAYEEGELTTPDEILYFFEKPWKFAELHDLYDSWLCAQGEAQDERNLSEP